LKSALDRPESLRVLEVGCGAGKFLSSLSQDLPRHRYTGLEPNPAALEHARRNAPAVQFFSGSAEQLPFEAESFDAVLALDVLEHVQDPDRVLSEIARVLVPRGLVHCFIPCEAQSIHGIAHRLLGFHSKAITCDHIQQYRRSEILERVRRHFDLDSPYYSYHFLGSLMDYALFTAILSPALAERFWRDNEYYNEVENLSVASRVMNATFRAGSAVAFWESKVMAKVGFGASGVHVTGRKRVGTE
jgi:SAM-dependent methyltransferase